MKTYGPTETAIALSLYGYNVAPFYRAQKLCEHFEGQCMEMEEFVELFTGPRAAYAVTEMPVPSAVVYVQHALDRYGEEAAERVRMGL